MKVPTLSYLPAVLLAGVLSGVAHTAHAADLDPAVRSEHVRIADLDLKHPQAIAKLYGRIRVAARSVCSPFEGRELAQYQQHEECVNQAIDAAIVEVANRDLTAYAQSRSPHRHASLAAARLSASVLPPL